MEPISGAKCVGVDLNRNYDSHWYDVSLWGVAGMGVASMWGEVCVGVDLNRNYDSHWYDVSLWGVAGMGVASMWGEVWV